VPATWRANKLEKSESRHGAEHPLEIVEVETDAALGEVAVHKAQEVIERPFATAFGSDPQVGRERDQRPFAVIIELFSGRTWPRTKLQRQSGTGAWLPHMENVRRQQAELQNRKR
jgi:hypothetical protein